MDAFWAGLAVGFAVLLLGRVEGKKLEQYPGLPSYRPTVGPDASSGAGVSAAAAASDCNCCGTGAPNQPSAVVLGTPYAPAPVTLKPAAPYSGESQWYAGSGQVGPGAATWGVN